MVHAISPTRTTSPMPSVTASSSASSSSAPYVFGCRVAPFTGLGFANCSEQARDRPDVMPLGTVCSMQCTQRMDDRTVGMLPWGPLVFVCARNSTSSSGADADRVVTGSWLAVPSHLWAPINSSVLAAAANATQIKTVCIPLSVTAPREAALRLDACGVVRRLTWPGFALDSAAVRLLAAAEVDRPWSNGSFAREAQGQAAVARRVLFSPIPQYRIVFGFAPTLTHGDCLLNLPLADVGGHVSEHVFRVEDVRATLAARLQSCNVSSQAAYWNVSLRVGALTWDAQLSEVASPGELLAGALLAPVTFGNALLSGGVLSLRAIVGNDTCRVVLPSFSMLSSAGLAPSPIIRVPGAVVVSDALPPVVLTLSAPVPPAMGETLSASCELASTTPSIAASGLVQMIAQSTIISQNDNASMTLSGLFQYGALPLKALPLVLTCNIMRSISAEVFPVYNASFSVSQPLSFLPARWPFFENAIIHYDNVPPVYALALNEDNRLATTVEPLPFVILTPTSVNVTLLGDTRHWLRDETAGQFSSDTSVYVGGVQCRTFPEENGSRLKFLMPLFDEVCTLPNASTCALPITVRNPLPRTDLAVQVSCPPFCPDGLPKSASGLPLAVGIASIVASGSSSGAGKRRLEAAVRTVVVVPAAAAPSELLASVAIQQLPSDASAYDMGPRVLYVSECLNGSFTDYRLPNSPCSNASDPRSFNCALGSRDECVTCPRFALCPGGGVMRPRAGFFVASESSRDITPCAPPDDRCLGWNASSNTVTCAPRFRSRSPGCGVCADMHFPTLDGDCAPCRAAVTVDSAILSAVGIVLGAIVGVVVTLVGGAWLAVRVMEGGTVKNVVKRGVQLLVILVTGMQVQVVVSERANSGLPQFVTNLYAYLQIFTFTDLGIHPACTGKFGVFRVQLSLFLAATCLLLFQLLLLINWRRILGCKCCGLRKRELRTLFASTVTHPHDIPDSALDEASAHPAARASLLACCRRPSSITRSQRRLDLQRQSELKQRKVVLAAQPWHVRLGVAYAERKPQLRRLLFIVSTLMFPAVVGNILQAVHCVPKDVRVRDYRSMGQDGTTLRTLGIAQRPSLQLNSATGQVTADADSDRIIRVRVLARDPYFVCAEGEHRLVFSWALSLLAVYVVLQPLATFLLSRAALARLVSGTCAIEHLQALEHDRSRQRAYLDDADAGLVFAFRKLNVMCCCGGRRYVHAQSGGAAGSDAQSSAPAGQAFTFDSHNPLQQSRRTTTAAAPSPPATPPSTAAGAVVTADDLVDRAVAGGQCADSAVEYFLRGDFRATRYWMRHIDLLLLLLLTVANKAWPQPAGVDARISSLILRACMTWAAIGAVGLIYAAQRPFTPENAFLRVVKLMHFGVIAALESINLVNAMIQTRRCQSLEATSLTECQATSLTGTAGPLEASLSLSLLVVAQAVLSVAVFVLALLFFVVAFVSFSYALYSSIEREASEQHQEAVAAAAVALQRPGGVRALAQPTLHLSSAAAATKRRVQRVNLDEHVGDDADAATRELRANPAKPEELAVAKSVLAATSRQAMMEGGRGGLSSGVSALGGDLSAVAARSGARKTRQRGLTSTSTT